MSANELPENRVSSPNGSWTFMALVKRVVLLVVLVIVAVLGWRIYHQNLYSDLIQKANVASNSGNHENVIKLIEQAAKIDSSDPAIHRLLAKSHIAQKQWKDALQALSRIDSPNSDDLEQLAMLAANQRDWAASAKAWIGLRGLSARAEAMLTQYMTTLQQSSNIADLADLCSQISEQTKDQPNSGYILTEMTLAVLNQERGFHRRALDHWDRVFRSAVLTKNSSDSRRNDSSLQRIPVQYAASLLRSGRHQSALEVLDTNTSKDDLESLWLKSRAYIQAGNSEAAKQAIELYKSSSTKIKPDDYRFAEPAEFVGASKCQPCHAEQFRLQSGTHHAESFGLADFASMSDHWPTGSIADPEFPETNHRFRPAVEGQRPQVEVVGKQGIDVKLHFRLGSGTRGQTFIAHTDQPKLNTIEYRMSIYPTHGWDLTTGQDKASSNQTPSDSTTLGRPLHWTEQFSCLRCHNSDPETALNASPTTPHDKLSIRCETCHGPGGNHVKAVELKLHELDLALTQPKKFTARESVRLCASCHQPDQFDDSRDPLKPNTARFQTIGLQASKCFKQSETLSCITCHSPHSQLIRNDDKFYNSKCTECHQDLSKLQCPTDKLTDGGRSGSCVQCHMPEVSGVMRHTSFADHYIRVPSK